MSGPPAATLQPGDQVPFQPMGEASVPNDGGARPDAPGLDDLFNLSLDLLCMDVERTRQTIDVLGSEEIHQFENRYICRDGSIRWLQWNTRPGPGEGLVAAGARDVTDSRAREGQAALRRVATLVAHRAEPAEVFDAVAAEGRQPARGGLLRDRPLRA